MPQYVATHCRVDGHDFPRLIDERVPGVTAVIDDVVEGLSELDISR